MLALIGPGELLFIAYLLFVIPVVLGCFALWIGSLIHCVRNRRLSETSRLMWAVVICLTHVIGAILYLFIGRPGNGPAATPAVS
jgi:uncharacterized sodium:solute symporter family permease YidK